MFGLIVCFRLGLFATGSYLDYWLPVGLLIYLLLRDAIGLYWFVVVPKGVVFDLFVLIDWQVFMTCTVYYV